MGNSNKATSERAVLIVVIDFGAFMYPAQQFIEW